MSITTEKKPRAGGLAGRNGIIALIIGGAVGMGAVGLLLTKAFRPARPGAREASAGEAKLAAKGDAVRGQAEAGVSRMRQEEVGSGYQFDPQGNYIPPKVDGRDLPDNQPLVTLEAGNASRRAAPPEAEAAPSWPKSREDSQDTDPALARERREARKEDRQDLQGSMLGYTTSASATWAARRAGREGRDMAEASSQTPEDAQVRTSVRSMERLTALAEKALTEGVPAAPRMPAETESQPVPPGEVADLRISGGAAPDVLVREGKFLDCVTINRVESDIAESPVMAQVARDFVSLDGKQVLVPAGARIYGTAGRVQSLQQARLYVRFHKLVFPRRTPDETPKVAYFPTRQFPAMDNFGSLGARDRVNRHLTLQFGAAIFLGVFDGLAAQVQSPAAEDNPTARDLVLARTSKNFSSVVDAVIQRYANVVPTVTIREGTKLKCYFTQDVLLTPFMPTGELSWVKGRP